MPRYVCDRCDAVFDSKDGLAAHDCGEDGGMDVLARVRGTAGWLRGLNRKQLFTLVGVFLMSTLFMGTAFFYSSISPGAAPSGGSSSPNEPQPPVGYTIRSQGDVPTDVDFPDRTVVAEQLGDDVQLGILAGAATGNPAVLLQYSCTDCPETVDRLERTAQRYNGGQTWVFVAPYHDMEERISLTAFQRGRKLDAFNRTVVDSFICTSLQNRPVECVVS